MNYFELPEYASVAPFEIEAAVAVAPSPSPLERLVAGIHRRAVAPPGYRFVANIAAEDVDRARRTVRQVTIAGELRLVDSAVDAVGNPVPGAALYVRDHLPEPEAFWSVFGAPDRSHAA